MRTVIRDKEISDSEEESDSENDPVVVHYNSAESSESEINEDDLVPVVQLLRRTRSGRRCIGTSFSRYSDCFLYTALLIETYKMLGFQRLI